MSPKEKTHSDSPLHLPDDEHCLIVAAISEKRNTEI